MKPAGENRSGVVLKLTKEFTYEGKIYRFVVAEWRYICKECNNGSVNIKLNSLIGEHIDNIDTLYNLRQTISKDEYEEPFDNDIITFTIQQSEYHAVVKNSD